MEVWGGGGRGVNCVCVSCNVHEVLHLWRMSRGCGVGWGGLINLVARY